MNPARDIDLIDQLRAEPAETSWLEFKSNNTDPEMIGKRCSALANSARIEGQDLAYMVWGIADGTHAVVGTEFNPDARKVGNQGLPLWLAVVGDVGVSLAVTLNALRLLNTNPKALSVV